MSAVDFFSDPRPAFREADPPALTPEEEQAVERFWLEALERQPAFFDGPAVACLGIERELPDRLTVVWVRSSYRYRVLRKVAGASWRPASLFATVLQPVCGGGLVVGRGLPGLDTV
ncbi:hypothetical protein [Kitasatospora sp. NPDC088134]|uniref:hypothetical protein n=1 Tax=Kitasatospora sp. NPDC088134 TaxID=3364071 RepID=UPI00380CDF73